MHIPLVCQCGKQVLVTEGSAGASLPCDCGRTIQVPSLGELRRRVAGDELPCLPSERPPARHPVGKAIVSGCGGLVFVLGVGLFLGNVTGLFPTFPFAGFLVMTLGGALLGAGAATRGPESPLERAFRTKVQTKLDEYRDWSDGRALSGCRLLRYRWLRLVAAQDVPLAQVERQVEALLYQGLRVDWAEDQGRLYLRAWDPGGPEPAWAKVFAEQPLADPEAIRGKEP
jgi:hypothetical protein